MKLLTILEKDDMEKFNNLNNEEITTESEKIFKRFWRSLGYRYNFQVNKVTIKNTGEVFKDENY